MNMERKVTEKVREESQHGPVASVQAAFLFFWLPVFLQEALEVQDRENEYPCPRSIWRGKDKQTQRPEAKADFLTRG